MDSLTRELDVGAAMPEQAPLDMPLQDLASLPVRKVPGLRGRPGLFVLRAGIVLATALLTAAGAREMALALDVASPLSLEGAVLILFVALFAWIAFSFVSCLVGIFSLLGSGGLGLGIVPGGPLPTLRSRTALLVPVYNEEPARVFGALEAMIRALHAAGAAERFDLFVLSDTTDPDIWVAEEKAWMLLRDRIGGALRAFYRHRRHNTDRKAGNLAEWVTSHGAAYPAFIVLDADSVMSAEALIRLAGAMEANPGVGLIQTLPVIVGGRSLFARSQAFAARVYGGMIAHGIAAWYGTEGNYWGHNAIIRTRAFSEAAGLPHLQGPRPFGGHILSHDFVEAALLRRRGWGVCFVPGLPGSYEEGPPSLHDLAVRDRRWCQGNLQHIAVLPARGLHPVSRTHLLIGIGAYLTAPMWLAFLLLGVALALQTRFVRPVYFPAGPTLFPEWPVVDPVRAMWVFLGTMALLLAPKVFAWFALVIRGDLRRRVADVPLSFVGVIVESVLSGLMAPITMLTQSRDVVSILSGRDGGWRPQVRDDGTLSWRQAAWLYGWHTLIGVTLGIAAALISSHLALWMAPVVLGLALAVPLAVLTADVGTGQVLLRVGVLSTPEESTPPSILIQAASLRTAWRALMPPREAVGWLQADPALLSLHRRLLPPARRRGAPIEARPLVAALKVKEAETLSEALSTLTPLEKADLLAEAKGLDQLLALRG